MIVTDSERSYYPSSDTAIIMSDVSYLFFSTWINDAQRIFAERDFGDGLVQTPRFREETSRRRISMAWPRPGGKPGRRMTERVIRAGHRGAL